MSSGWRIVTDGVDDALVFLALGTNLGDRARQLRDAVRALRRIVDIDALSGIYESDPAGYAEQPRFWNMVLRGRTALPPHALLDAVKQLERELGREPTFHMGPRTIDIDVLLYDEMQLDEAGLQLPHPRMHERRFVLQPLADIEPDRRLNHVDRTVAQQLTLLDDGPLQHVGAAPDVLLDVD